MPTPSNPHVTTALMEIDPPLLPASLNTNNSEWLWIGWLVSILFILVAVYYLLRTRRTRSLHHQCMHLYHQLTRIIPTPPSHTSSISQQNACQLYSYCQKIRPLIPPSHSSYHTTLQNIMKQLTPLCFAKPPVSRETYMALLKQTQQLLISLSKETSNT